MRLTSGTLCLALLLIWTARAEEKGAKPEEMQPPRPAPEMRAVDPFMQNMVWTTTIAAGAMAPGSPPWPAHGRQKCHSLWGGFAYSCDLEDTVVNGKHVTTWHGHAVLGWDQAAKTYQLLLVSNMNGTLPMKGRIEGKKFIMETPNEVSEMEKTFKGRLTLDLGAGRMTDERFIDGKWTVFESGTLRVVGGPRTARR